LAVRDPKGQKSKMSDFRIEEMEQNEYLNFWKNKCRETEKKLSEKHTIFSQTVALLRDSEKHRHQLKTEYEQIIENHKNEKEDLMMRIETFEVTLQQNMANMEGAIKKHVQDSIKIFSFNPSRFPK